MSFKIIGTGSALPEKVVTNFDLAEFLDTSDEWIRTRTGIIERRVINNESMLDLAEKAALGAINSANLKPSDIDMIIFSTLQGDYVTPSMSCLLQKRLNAPCQHVFDINIGCSGFIFALDLADSYVSLKKAKNVLIVCCEILSRFVNWQDRSTCVLFGDGAGAVVVSEGESLIDIKFTISGNAEHLGIHPVAGNSPFSESDQSRKWLYMNGQEIYKFAVESITRDIKEALERNSLSPDDIAYFILHQANLRIINSAKQKLNQPDEKFPHNLERYGNTSSATIPILLDEVNRKGLIKNGDKVVLDAFGSGLTTAVCILNWIS